MLRSPGDFESKLEERLRGFGDYRVGKPGDEQSNDIAMLRGHAIASGTPRLDLSAHLMSGEADAIVPASVVARWAGYFGGPVRHHVIAGGHFFAFRDSRDRVLDLLTTILRATVVRSSRA